MKISYLLPYYIPTKKPINFGTRFTTEQGDEIEVHLYFTTRFGNKRVDNIYGAFGENSRMEYSLVEATFHGTKIDKWADLGPSTLQSIIRSGLTIINEILAALIATKEFMHMLPINMGDLPMMVPVDIDDKMQPFITDPYKLYDHNFSCYEDEDIDNVILVLKKWKEPADLTEVNRLYYLGKQSIINSQYITGVIELQTSFEIYVNKIIRAILQYKGYSASDISKTIETTNFRRKIESLLSKHLEIDLSPKSNEIVREWKECLYDLRNQIVHEGRLNLNQPAGNKALSSFLEIYNYLAELVKSKYSSIQIKPVELGILERSSPEERQKIIEKIMTKIEIHPR